MHHQTTAGAVAAPTHPSDRSGPQGATGPAMSSPHPFSREDDDELHLLFLQTPHKHDIETDIDIHLLDSALSLTDWQLVQSIDPSLTHAPFRRHGARVSGTTFSSGWIWSEDLQMRPEQAVESAGVADGHDTATGY